MENWCPSLSNSQLRYTFCTLAICVCFFFTETLLFALCSVLIELCFFNFCFATLLQVAPMIFVIILFTLHLSVFLITFFLHIPLCQLHLAFIFSHFLALFLSLPYLLSSTCTFFLHSALYTFFYCALCDLYSVPVWIWIWIWWRIWEEGHRKQG